MGKTLAERAVAAKSVKEARDAQRREREREHRIAAAIEYAGRLLKTAQEDIQVVHIKDVNSSLVSLTIRVDGLTFYAKAYNDPYRIGIGDFNCYLNYVQPCVRARCTNQWIRPVDGLIQLARHLEDSWLCIDHQPRSETAQPRRPRRRST